MIRETTTMDRAVDRSGRTTKRIVVATIVLVVIAAASVVLAPTVRRWGQASESIDASRLRFGTAERGTLVRDVSVAGRVVAANHPTLFSPASGIVTIAVREGEVVERGELLARVESPELENLLEQERAGLAALESELRRREIALRQEQLTNRQDVDLLAVRLEAARRERDRNATLFGEGLVGELDYRSSEDRVRLTELELEHARQQLAADAERSEFELEDARQQLARHRLIVAEAERRVAELSIYAPFDGLVATLAVDDRDAVREHEPILGVVDLGVFEVEVRIPESYADDCGLGVPAEIRLGAETWPGTLTRLSPEVVGNEVLGTVVFEEAAPAALRQGQRVRARLLLEERRDVVVVPRGSFVEAGGREIWVVDGGLLSRREIRLGATSIRQVEIEKGLAEGEVVVLSDMSRHREIDTLLLRP